MDKKAELQEIQKQAGEPVTTKSWGDYEEAGQFGIIRRLRRMGSVKEGEVAGLATLAKSTLTQFVAAMRSAANDADAIALVVGATCSYLYFVVCDSLEEEAIDQLRKLLLGEEALPIDDRRHLLAEIPFAEMSWGPKLRHRLFRDVMVKFNVTAEKNRVPVLGDYLNAMILMGLGCDSFGQTWLARAGGGVKNSPERVAFLSLKGGVGKSTLALATALVLAQQKRRVGFVDLDVSGTCLKLTLDQHLEPPRGAPQGAKGGEDYGRRDFATVWNYRSILGASLTDVAKHCLWQFKQWPQLKVCLMPLNAIWRSELARELMLADNRVHLDGVLECLREVMECETLVLDCGPGLMYQNFNVISYLNTRCSSVVLVSTTAAPDIGMNAYNIPWDLDTCIPGKRIFWLCNMCDISVGTFGERSGRPIEWLLRTNYSTGGPSGAEEIELWKKYIPLADPERGYFDGRLYMYLIPNDETIRDAMRAEPIPQPRKQLTQAILDGQIGKAISAKFLADVMSEAQPSR